MQAFKVNRDSWHYKLNQKFMNERGDNEWYMRDNWEQRHNNFCSYWRVTMFRLLFALLIAIFIITVLFMIGEGIYQDPWTALMIVSSAIGIFTAFIGLLAVAAYLDNRKYKYKSKESPDSLFIAKYKSYKSKVCPMVEYEK
jgi:membrane protein YdbS with pleckstrin-like domain